MRKIKKGDDVIVIAGKDKGKRGNVTRVLPEGRVIVEGANMIKRHTKPNPNAGQAGGIVEREASLDDSNIAIFNTATGKADRIGFRTLEDGRKVRYFKSTKEVLDV
jgi:large subunit ribosomal protein L24